MPTSLNFNSARDCCTLRVSASDSQTRVGILIFPTPGIVRFFQIIARMSVVRVRVEAMLTV